MKTWRCGQCAREWSAMNDDGDVPDVCPDCGGVVEWLDSIKEEVTPTPTLSARQLTGIMFYADMVTAQLGGAKILRGVIDDKSGSWGMLVKFPGSDEFPIWIDCDEEGNGPGAISIGQKTISKATGTERRR